jgi:hypothetical protein
MSNNASIVHVIEEEEDFVPQPPVIDDDDDDYLSDSEIPPLIPFERQSSIVNIIEQDKNRYGKDLSFHAEISEEEMLFGFKEHEFCDICCESWTNMTASCGHKYCAFCVIKIIIAEKKNAPQPRCSFCRVPFNKFTTPSIATAVVLTDWAEKSFPNTL